jgi:predicted GNAT family acetyltransferase
MAARATFQKSFNIRVTHNESLTKFIIPTSDGDIALLYTEVGNKTWRFTETQVPAAARNGQIINRIIEYAFETARKSNHDIEAACPTVQGFLARNPFYQSLLA